MSKRLPKKFIFEKYILDKKEARVDFYYSFDGKINFKESIGLPDKKTNWKKVDNIILNKVLFNLHLAIGIGYYKAYCPKQIVVKSGRLNRNQASFWNKLYTKGLGEFFFQNKIDYRGLINFPFSDHKNTSVKKVFKDRCLSPIGGGKDSCLSAEKLIEMGKEIALISLRDSLVQEKTAKLINRPRYIVSRQMDPLLFELNKLNAYNGHVPVSAIYSWISILIAALKDYRYVIFANEASANYGNVNYLGEEINHQYSKTFEFERDLANYLKAYVSTGLEYFSLLRPFSELKITSEFGQHTKYLLEFSSCNRNFKINNPSDKRWCGECPKCAFTYTLLSAFKTKKELKKIFDKDLFTDSKLLPLFQELWGEKRIKPFDCVGTPEEVRAAFLLTSLEKSFSKDLVMKYFKTYIAPKINNKKKIIEDAFSISADHAVPVNFRKTLILGWGEEGKYLFRHYRSIDPKMKLWVADKNNIDLKEDKNTVVISGKDYLNNLSDFDVIAKSPGIPASLAEIENALLHGTELTSVSKIFFTAKRDQIIGITGTKGKSTTSSLIYSILKAAKKDVYLVGNIGADPLRLLNKGKDSIFVYELSSYQLSTLKVSPRYAVYVSLFPDHLPYHQGFDKYAEAKANIANHQLQNDIFVYNGDFAIIKQLAQKSKAKTIDYNSMFGVKNSYLYFNNSKIISLDDIKLPGNHNLKNISAAIAVALSLKISKKTIIKGISSFKGLSHRLEKVGTFKGITFYDDAISTTPESTIAAIDYLKDKIGCILLGGEDRGYDFTQLAISLAKINLQAIVFFPDSGAKIKSALIKSFGKNNLPTIIETKQMDEAIKFAYKYTTRGRVCLLSTASPSYSIFKNYKEKGELFSSFAKKYGKL